MRPTDVLELRRKALEFAQSNIQNGRDAVVSRLDAKCLRSAEVFFVNDDMTTLVESSWPSLPAGNLAEEEIPAPSGFLVYNRPIWGMFFSDAPDADADADAEAKVCGFMWDTVPEGTHIAFSPLGNLHDWDDPALQVAPMRSGPTDVGSSLASAASKPLRATWAFMRQKIAATQKETADRNVRRRSARLGISGDAVNVVRVRSIVREPSAGEQIGGTDWSCRWLVAGHWRNQYYPSLGHHRPQWITGYVKGPDDKPLVVKERVTAWVR